MPSRYGVGSSLQNWPSWLTTTTLAGGHSSWRQPCKTEAASRSSKCVAPEVTPVGLWRPHFETGHPKRVSSENSEQVTNDRFWPVRATGNRHAIARYATHY